MSVNVSESDGSGSESESGSGSETESGGSGESDVSGRESEICGGHCCLCVIERGSESEGVSGGDVISSSCERGSACASVSESGDGLVNESGREIASGDETMNGDERVSVGVSSCQSQTTGGEGSSTGSVSACYWTRASRMGMRERKSGVGLDLCQANAWVREREVLEWQERVTTSVHAGGRWFESGRWRSRGSENETCRDPFLKCESVSLARRELDRRRVCGR